MGLTWRDLVSSVAVVVSRSRMPLLSSAWGASAVELVLACVCAVAAAYDLHTRPQPWHGRIFRRITTVLGVIALLAGLAGLITNSGQAVEVVVVATTFLWLTGTMWHVLAIGAPPGEAD
jgi:hypothetical protein